MSRKKEIGYLIALSLLLAITGQVLYSFYYLPQKAREVSVYYNRDVEANQYVVKAIQDADDFVYFAIYTFTRTDIKDALLGAKHRGLTVVGITDKNQIESLESQRKIVKELRDASIPVYTQNHSAIMHLKTLVTEKSYVSGSYNWTLSATEKNDEVIEVGRDPVIRKEYERVLLELFQRYGT